MADTTTLVRQKAHSVFHGTLISTWCTVGIPLHNDVRCIMNHFIDRSNRLPVFESTRWCCHRFLGYSGCDINCLIWQNGVDCFLPGINTGNQYKERDRFHGKCLIKHSPITLPPQKLCRICPAMPLSLFLKPMN